MSVAMFVVYDIWGFFFLLLIEIISIAKLLIIVHFFVLKHEKQTLSYINTKFEGDWNTSFFSPIYFVGAPVFLPQHWKLLGPERLMPLKLLGMNSVKKKRKKKKKKIKQKRESWLHVKDPFLRKTMAFFCISWNFETVVQNSNGTCTRSFTHTHTHTHTHTQTHRWDRAWSWANIEKVFTANVDCVWRSKNLDHFIMSR